MILLGFHEETETAVALFPFLQRGYGLVRLDRMAERLDGRQSLAPLHFQFAAILPRRGEIWLQFGRALDLLQSLFSAPELRECVAALGPRSRGFWIETRRVFRILQPQCRLVNFVELPGA